jgi:hypothetical protein
MKTTTPFKAPHAPEPEAVLTFGDIEIRLTLTYLHHLRNCQGWGDKHANNTMRAADNVMELGMQDIERAMWASTDEET